ncbi:MAG: response regulator transcription factor [Chitinophagaceae bacterium]|nr:MAG: response regulator transcription factor [Chitinophagaceae bacterium]
MPDRIYQCLIVDDEPPAREVLRRYIEQMPQLAIAGEASNAVQAMVTLQQQPIDLLFLDIHMPKLSGIDLIKSYRVQPKIILTTAYEQYALQAFDLEVTDYLLKPIAFERFVKAVMKALPDGQASAPVAEKTAIEPPFLYLRSDRKMVKVYLDKIYYIESLKDYVRVRTQDGDIISKHSMAALEAILPQQQFVRVHRSFIAAIDKVQSFTPDKLTLPPGEIPIGKLYRLQVLKLLK